MSDVLRLELSLADLRAKFSEDQPRDDHGRFAGAAGGGGTATATFTTMSDDDFRRLRSGSGLGLIGERENAAVDSYTGSGFRNINGALREGAQLSPDDPMQQAIEALDTYTHTQTLPQDTLLYRMGGHTPDEYVPSEVGEKFRDRGFVSTSAVEGMYPVVGKQQGITIEAPAGTPFGFGSFGEREVILPRDTEFEVKSSEANGQFVTLRAVMS